MTRRSLAPLRGWIAPLLAALAAPVGALFVCSCGAGDGLSVLVWQATTGVLVLAACSSRRWGAQPAVAAGLFGVAVWAGSLPIAIAFGDGSLGAGLAWLASGLAVAALAAVLAERPSVLGSTTLPSQRARLLTTAVSIASLGWAWLAATEAPRAQDPDGQVLATLEIPALATQLRERIDGEPGLEVLGVSEPQPGGGATAFLTLRRDPGGLGALGGMPAVESDVPCVVPVGPMGRGVQITAAGEQYVVRWPESPHGESFGACTFDRTTLARMMDRGVTAHAPHELRWGPGMGTAFGAMGLLLAWRVRRRHARIARSPEVRVTSPGIATMPDGSPAVIGEDVPMGSSVVALAISDVRPDYRSDARVAISEHVAGEKVALLADLARRARTLELCALAGVCLFASVLLGTSLAAIVLGP